MTGTKKREISKSSNARAWLVSLLLENEDNTYLTHLTGLLRGAADISTCFENGRNYSKHDISSKTPTESHALHLA